MNKEEHQKCCICGKEKYVLIKVDVEKDYFLANRGVCETCLKTKDISEELRKKGKKIRQEQIEEHKKEIKKLEDEIIKMIQKQT